jgi:hypothetical protein
MTWGFGATQRFRVQATDGVGNTTPWTYGPTFRVAMNEDTNAVNKYGGTWSTISTAAASGGTLRSTTQSGAYVTETFTGVGIAWIAYRGPTRGKARVYVDGVLLATVDLYSATAHGKAVVYAKAWTTAGTHTIKVVNLATSGRPRIDLDAFAPLVVS